MNGTQPIADYPENTGHCESQAEVTEIDFLHDVIGVDVVVEIRPFNAISWMTRIYNDSDANESETESQDSAFI